jgi:hypothetical protein
VHAPRGGPKVAKTFSLQLSLAAPSAPSLIVTSASKTQWGSFKLPLDLPLSGAPGCQIFVSLYILVLAQVNKSGVATMSFGIPNDTRLVNQKFFNEAFCLDGNTNKLGLVFSNGGQVSGTYFRTFASRSPIARETHDCPWHVPVLSETGSTRYRRQMVDGGGQQHPRLQRDERALEV